MASNLWAEMLIVALIVYMGLSLFRTLRSPMWRIPGPKVTAFTRLYEFYYNGLKGNTYSNRISAMHRRYGPIVRINPNEVHIHDPDLQLSFGQYPLAQRDPWYYNVGIPHATGMLTDNNYHQSRRTAGAAKLVPLLMRQGQNLVQKRSELLCRRFRQYASDGVAVNLSDAVRSLACDWLSVIFWGTSDDFLGEADLGHQRLLSTRAMFRDAAVARQFPVLLSLVRFIPAWAESYLSPLLHEKRIIAQTVTERVEESSSSKEGKCLAETATSGTTPIALHEVIDDITASFVGGSEAIGHSLTHIFYHLMQQPDIITQLRAELGQNGFDLRMAPRLMTNRFPILQSIVKEGLRTQEGNTFRMPRVAEKDMEWGGYFLPAGTVISMTPIDIHLDPTIFPNPDCFLPSRWLGPDSARLDRYLFAFGDAPHRCLASTFVRMALQYVLAATLSQFDIFPVHGKGEFPRDGSMEMFPPHAAVGILAYVSTCSS